MKRRSYFDYRRSAKVDWAVLRMEAPFLNYDFVYDQVSGLPDGGPHYGLRIYGLRKRCELVGFHTVCVMWLAESSNNLAEASDDVGESSDLRQTV